MACWSRLEQTCGGMEAIAAERQRHLELQKEVRQRDGDLSAFFMGEKSSTGKWPSRRETQKYMRERGEMEIFFGRRRWNWINEAMRQAESFGVKKLTN